MPKTLTLLTDFFRSAPPSSVTATKKTEREKVSTTKIIGLSDSDSDSDDDAKANSDDSASDSDDNAEVSDPEDVVPLKELKRRALADMKRKREELKRKRV